MDIIIERALLMHQSVRVIAHLVLLVSGTPKPHTLVNGVVLHVNRESKLSASSALVCGSLLQQRILIDNKGNIRYQANAK